MNENIIPFPKAKKPRPLDDHSAACAKAASEALTTCASDIGDYSASLMKSVRAVAAIFDAGE